MEAVAVESAVHELIIFQVGNILCAASIAQVQEINQNLRITPVHHAPEYVKGVVNLRGQIVTVIDLGQKFGVEAVEQHTDRCIVVVRFAKELIGLLVDDVQDVIWAHASDIEATPGNVSGIQGAFFSGIYKMSQGLVAIVNFEEVLKYDSGIGSFDG